MQPRLPVNLPAMVELGFDGLYGLELLELTDELVRGHGAVRDDLKQPAGLVHGGVHAAIAESLASFGTAFAVMPEGKLAMGLSNQTSFLRPITQTWVWEIEIFDDQARLCVLSRVTIAVRDA